jgi:hypothetical protein
MSARKLTEGHPRCQIGKSVIRQIERRTDGAWTAAQVIANSLPNSHGGDSQWANCEGEGQFEEDTRRPPSLDPGSGWYRPSREDTDEDAGDKRAPPVRRSHQGKHQGTGSDSPQPDKKSSKAPGQSD